MREVIVETNKKYRNEFSTDLGAFTGMLYEIGIQRLLVGDDYISDEERKKLESVKKKKKKVYNCRW